MRKLLLFLVLFPLGAVGQAFYQFNQPFPNAVFRVCPVPSGGNPCPSPVAIFSDSGLSQGITQPVTVGKDGNYGFWVAAGQYTIEIAAPYNLVYIISLGGGGGSGGAGTVNSGNSPDIAFYPTTGTAVSADPDLTYQSISHAHTFGVGGINLPGTSGQVTLKGTGTITSYTLLFPTSVVPGFWRTDGAGNITYTELSGDCTTSGSGAITCTKSNGTSFGTGAFISSTAGGDLSGTLPSPSVVGLHFGATGLPLGAAPTSGQCLEYNGTNITGAACSGGGGSVTTTGTPANGNLTKFSGATTITNGDLSGDVTTAGTLATTAVGLHFGATGIPLGTAPTSGQCLEFNGTNITGAACSGGGSGTVNNATQFSAAYYSAAGSSNVLSGVAAPTAPANVPLFFTSTNSGGVAQAPGWTLAGIPGRTVTVSTDSIQATDRTAWIVYNSSSAVATSLSQAGTSGFDNFFAFGVKNIGTAAVTITPTTSTIDGGTTLVVTQGQNCTIATLDNTNYVSRCASGQITGGTNITVTPSANGLQISTGAGGTVTNIATSSPISGGPITATGTISCPTCVTSAAALTNNAVVIGGGLQASSTISADTTTTHALFATATAPAFRAVATGDLPGSGATTVNGQTCTLGSTCNVNSGATAHTVAVNEAAGAAIAGAGPGTSGQVLKSAGSSTDPVYIDFPDVRYIPAANCNATTAGDGWSIGSGGTVTCRAGTNNKGGFISITDTSTTFATFQIEIPEDWDTASNPFIRFQIASTDTTSGHTIIPSIQVACYKGDGTTTDDVAPNAAHSLSTITTNVTANQFWSTSNVQMNATDMTGCVAGALMQVTVGRATDTSTNAEFYGATITFPLLLSVQAN